VLRVYEERGWMDPTDRSLCYKPQITSSTAGWDTLGLTMHFRTVTVAIFDDDGPNGIGNSEKMWQADCETVEKFLSSAGV
jgi:hypothetical protein